MDENRKKAYRFLLYQTAVKSRAGVGRNPGFLVRRGDRIYMNETRMLNELLHNLAQFNYSDRWEEFSESWFWRDILKKEKEFPDMISLLKGWFSKVYTGNW